MKELNEVLTESFKMVIDKMETIKDVKKSSYVGKVYTQSGKTFVVKSLFVDPSRQRFITEVERLLYQRGVMLACPVKTCKNQFFFMHRGHPYVLYPWIPGEPLSLHEEKHLLQLTETMARFHILSADLTFPSNVNIYSHRDWVEEYQLRIHTMKTFRKKNKHAKNKIKRYISEKIPYFIGIGTEALRLLKMSHYPLKRNEPFRKQTLVHGDFHHNNVLVNGNEEVIIDFEDVRYDFPSKDILRLFSMYCMKNAFNHETFERMMKTYEKVHRLQLKTKEVVYIDLLFPHIFEHMIRKKRYKKGTLKEVKHLIKQEKNKADYLSSKIYDQFPSFQKQTKR